MLSFGGEETCFAFYELDLANIEARGQLWYGDNVKLMQGSPSNCHGNSAYLWEKKPKTRKIATGYALSDDGMWRQHSWVVELINGETIIVETTEPRVLYFGFVLSEEECLSMYNELTY